MIYIKRTIEQIELDQKQYNKVICLGLTGTPKNPKSLKDFANKHNAEIHKVWNQNRFRPEFFKNVIYSNNLIYFNLQGCYSLPNMGKSGRESERKRILKNITNIEFYLIIKLNIYERVIFFDGDQELGRIDPVQGAELLRAIEE